MKITFQHIIDGFIDPSNFLSQNQLDKCEEIRKKAEEEFEKKNPTATKDQIDEAGNKAAAKEAACMINDLDKTPTPDAPTPTPFVPQPRIPWLPKYASILLSVLVIAVIIVGILVVYSLSTRTANDNAGTTNMQNIMVEIPGKYVLNFTIPDMPATNGSATFQPSVNQFGPQTENNKTTGQPVNNSPVGQGQPIQQNTPNQSNNPY